jgi:protein-disulfide isomerase
MSVLLPRRQLLLSLLAVSASGALLAACGDEEEAKAPEETPPGGGGGEAPPAQGSVNMSKLLEEGALPEKAMGEADAPVTIVEYASMTCPHCATFHENTLPAIKERYIDTGKARLLFREFPFDPRAEAGFMLARCSEDRYFAMVDVLFKQQRDWAGVQDARSALLQISKLAGFSQESFESCLTNQQLLNDVRAVRARGASEFGVEATPTFFINGDKYSGALSVDEMSAIIESHL